MIESTLFNSLDARIRFWVDKQGWSGLRDIQEAAIEPILKCDRDVIISASTSSGKSEAVFLPACSKFLDLSLGAVGILYIAPLKALINDQYTRLESLSDIGISVMPWHGDISWSIKSSWSRSPEGILLITPESLESFLFNRYSWVKWSFSNLLYVVIDEFHTFMGTERGCQLLSLLNRLDFLLGRKVPRIALSATLGDLQSVRSHLRDSGEFPCEFISSEKHYSDMDIQLKGYLSSFSSSSPRWLGSFSRVYGGKDESNKVLLDDLYSMLRGKFNIVFTNSRKDVEEITVALRARSVRDGFSDEFFPHHGSLSAELRVLPEYRLKEGGSPTTVVSTFTLELGIDIGKVDSIVQVGASSLVSSLRQRLGRSGRRGNTAVLRLLVQEKKINKNSSFLDVLRLKTVQSVAIVNLLLSKSYEPPPPLQYHFSTLLQQTLSVMGQYSSFMFIDLWKLLCVRGPFKLVDKSLYLVFINILVRDGFLIRAGDGSFSLGEKGKELTSDYKFYSAFKTPLKYTVEVDGHSLGSISYDNNLSTGDSIIFGGDYWKVVNIDKKGKLINVNRGLGGDVPKFLGDGPLVHDIVRQEIFRIYKSRDFPGYLDDVAGSFFKEGVDNFHSLSLDNLGILERGSGLCLFPWFGDRVIRTIVVLFRNEGLDIYDLGFGIIGLSRISIVSFRKCVVSILSGAKPSATELARTVKSTSLDKYDDFLPRSLLDLSYGLKLFDVDTAWDYLASLV